MRHALLLLAALALAGCADAGPVSNGDIGFGSVGGNGSLGASVADARGDTLQIPSPDGTRAVDVLELRAHVGGGTLEIRLAFAEPVVPWSQGGNGALDGWVDIDLDEDPLTGIPAAANEHGVGDAGLGAEYYVSLRDLDEGVVGLVRASDQSAVGVPATFAGSTVTVRIPLSALDDDDGNLRLSALVGTVGRLATDMAPNSGYLSTRR